MDEPRFRPRLGLAAAVAFSVVAGILCTLTACGLVAWAEGLYWRR